MITKAHITRQAAIDGVPARTVERDYVLAHIIAGLAALDRHTGLVFKGGTALRLCHFADYRYSADLDFSIVSGSKDESYATITEALNVTHGTIEELRLTDASPPKIAYVGPLGRERLLKLDLADDELVINIEAKSLVPRWKDVPEDVSLDVYTLTEIAAEKLRCVLQRLQCRDLFDLSQLFTEGQVDGVDATNAFRPKAEHRGIDPALFADRYTARLGQYQQRWERELSEHVPGGVPPFNGLERGVTRVLRQAGLLA